MSHLSPPDHKTASDEASPAPLDPVASEPKSVARFDGAANVSCRGCNASNAASRRYCADCGGALYEACPQCSAEIAATEKFCGACGSDVEEKRRHKAEELQQALLEARRLQNDHEFEKAAEILRMVASLSDARLESLVREATKLLRQFAAEQLAFGDNAQHHLEMARRHLASFFYDKACAALESIPKPIRTGEMAELLRDATAKRNEMQLLRGEIRQALAENNHGEALLKLERLLVLKPDHVEGERLAKHLCLGICNVAREKLHLHQYEEAHATLESLPAFVRDEDVSKLVDKAAELAALTANLRLAPVADDATLALVERLLKIAPNAPEVEQRLTEMKRRRSAKPTNQRHAYPVCGANSPESVLGPLVEWLGHFTHCEAMSPEAAATLRAHPGEFFVALGLALQGRNEAAVDVNFLPTAKPRLLDSLSLSFLKPSARGAWGIDLGSTGLRAIKLAPKEADGRIRIEKVVHLAHAKSVTHADNEMAASEIVAQTLNTFREQHPFAKDKEKRDTVTICVPGYRSLGRFFELPPTPAEKLQDVIRYEAKHQIPIPVEELSWGYKTVQEAEGKAADKYPRHVMLFAARDVHVKERLAQFGRAEIPIDGVTTEPLALHNALHHEFFREANSPGTVALLEIGAKSSNLVVSSQDRAWCHNSGLSGDDFTNALVRHFQVTTSVAEALKRSPYKARRFYQFQSAMQPLFLRFRSEIARSLESFAKQFPGRKIERLYLTGGGATTHGLLRYLIHGE